MMQNANPGTILLPSSLKKELLKPLETITLTMNIKGVGILEVDEISLANLTFENYSFTSGSSRPSTAGLFSFYMIII